MTHLTRYLDWILLLLLLVTFLQIPVYIYVLEQHSNALSDIRERLGKIEVTLARSLTRGRH